MDNNHDINSRDETKNPDTNPVTSSEQDIIYVDFPKKYKRKITDALDKRFVIIWLITFVIHITTVIYFVNNIPQRTYDSTKIKDIQKKYAELILKKDQIKETKSVTPVKRTETKSPGKEQKTTKMDTESQSPAASFDGEEVAQNGQQRTEITQEQSDISDGTDMANVTQRPGVIRSGSDVSSKGLLGLLTGTSESEQQEGVQEIFGGTESGSKKLKSALSRVERIEKGGQADAGRAGSSTGQSREMKGTRTSGDEEISDLISDRTKAESQEIERQEGLEKEDISTMRRDKKVLAGNRDPDEISLVVHRHNKAIQSCYQRELRRNPELKGKVVVRFTIAPDGRVKTVQLISSTINNPRVERCVVSRIRRWDDFGSIDESLGDTTFRQVYNFGY